MVEAVLEQVVCEGCGVDVREGTLFCYNCGASIKGDEQERLADHKPETENNGHSPDEADKLAAAAIERKRSRVAHRKTAEYVWESTADEGAPLTLLIAVLITVFALLVVLMMVW